MADRGSARRWTVVVVAAALALVLAGGYAVALTRTPDPSSSYRTATVARGPVQQVLTLTGTVSRLDEVTATFPTSGTVRSVAVHVGQRVAQGQTLATMDPAALRAALLAADAQLAQAQASLDSDETATSTSTTATSTGSSSAGSTGSTGGTGGSSSGAGTAAAGSRTGSGSGSVSGTGSGSGSGSSSRTGSSTAGAGSGGTGGSTGSRGSGGSGGTGGSGRSGGQASTSHGSSSGSSTSSPLDTTAFVQAVKRAQAALAAQQTACAPVLGTTGSGTSTGRPGGRPSRSTTRTARLASVTSTGTPTPESTTPPPAPEPTGTGTDTSTAPLVSPTTSTPTTTTPTTSTPTTAPSGPTSGQLATCAAALQVTATSQGAAAARLTTLAGEVSRVVQQIARAAAAAGTGSTGGSSSTGTSARTGSGSTGATSRGGGVSAGGSGASGGTGGTGTQSTAGRIASDRVAVLQAQAAVEQAQVDLDGATLRAPVTGVVGQVDLTVGSPASTSTGIVVVGDGAAQVSVAVPLASVHLVTPGLAATVTPAGGTTGVPGSVTSVGLLPTSGTGTGAGTTPGAGSTTGSSSAATPSYPAHVLVAHPPTALAAGSSATVSLVVADTPDAVRLPVSALAGRDGGSASVQVLSGGVPTTRRVVVGAVGRGWAQVLTGLVGGERVVVADPSAALPTTTTGLRGLGGGGFGGGNLGGGRGAGGAGGAGASGGAATTGRTGARTG